MAKTPVPGDLLTPDKWIASRIVEFVHDDHTGGTAISELLPPGPIFVIAIDRDGHTAYVMTEKYIGWAMVTRLDTPLNISMNDDQVVVATGLFMLTFICLIAAAIYAFVN